MSNGQGGPVRPRLDPTGKLALAGLFGLVGASVLLYAVAARGDWDRAIAVSLLLGAAVFAVSSLVGFLFGIPRAAADATKAPNGSWLPNTNLEQVSDWLTKLLLGATLTQVGRIHDGFVSLASTCGAAIGGPAGTAYAGGVIALSAAIGFIAGWLATRLWLAEAFTIADAHVAPNALLRRADELAAAGQTGLSVQLTREAGQLLMSENASKYETVRETMPSGPMRTRELEKLVTAAAATSQDLSLTPSAVADQLGQGSDGERIGAIAIMQQRPDLADLDGLLAAVGAPRSAFEQFHALKAVAGTLAAGGVDETGRDRIADVVRSVVKLPQVQQSSGRLGVASAILDELAGP